MPLISVLMLSFNHDRYISDAINSVLNQNFRDLELIIIDDCSSDNSRRIIEAHQKDDYRIKAFFHRKNMGMAKTANECILKATGKYISFLDSDDLWVKSKLEKQVAILNSNDNLIVWSEGEIINADGFPTNETFTQLNLASDAKKSGDIFEILLNHNYIFMSSLIFKRDFATKIMFDRRLKYLNDQKFVAQLAKEHEFYYIEEPLVKYRVHGKNSILTDEKNWSVDRINLSNFFLNEYGKQISKKTKADLLFTIGWSYSLLNENRLSRFFSLRAFATKTDIWFFTFFLANGDFKIAKFFMSLFSKGASSGL